jgi:PIN domain nuclease of toxin-antitoxin system
MNLLLDTHIFLWFISGNPQLKSRWQTQIEDPANRVYLSVASVWEATIKYQLGKLPLPESPEIYLPRQRDRHEIASLTIDEGTIQQLPKLPALHRDPFDRILICQAIQHDLTLMSVDGEIKQYPIVKLAS